MRLTRATRTITVIVTALAAAGALQACDTPVYQYSMYEWRPDRYEVRYFYRAGEQSAADAAANDCLRAANLANLSFHAVEVAADGTVARQHATAWRGHRTSELPLHVVSAPGHGPIFADRLDAAAAEQLVDSPGRRELAGELSAGRAGVLVVLLDPAAGDGERVLQVARDAVAESADGERRVGLVSVDRTDPAEQWLVRQLLVVEDDLTDIAGSMVFGAFGRGHVLPPFVGKGVTPQGMRDLIAFIHGPCACELKTANPGLDLLMSWDWDGRLPQWATASATQPGFVLFDFTAEPDEGTPDRAAPVDPAPPDRESADPPVTDPAQLRTDSGGAAGPRSAHTTTQPAPVRVTPPAATVEPPPRTRPANAASDASAPTPPPAPEPEQPPAAATPDTAPQSAPPSTPAAQPPRLVARVPDLPTAGQARLANRLPAEESSFAAVLALRLGLTLLAVLVVAVAGHLVLSRAGGPESDADVAGSGDDT